MKKWKKPKYEWHDCDGGDDSCWTVAALADLQEVLECINENIITLGKQWNTPKNSKTD